MSSEEKKAHWTVDLYLEWFCDWLTIDCMAEYYEISEENLEHLINIGRIRNEALALQRQIDRLTFEESRNIAKG